MISLLSKARQELDADLHQLHLFGKEWLLEFEPKKSQGLDVSNTKKRKNTEKLHPPFSMGRIWCDGLEFIKDRLS